MVKCYVAAYARLFFFLSFILALLALLFYQFSLRGHGLLATHGAAPAQVELVAFVTANDGLNPLDALPAHFQGYLYLPTAQTIVFQRPQQLAARLLLDQQLIFETKEAPTTASLATTEEEATVALEAGFHPLELHFQPPTDAGQAFFAGLQWKSAWGWQLLPTRYLVPSVTTRQEAELAFWLTDGAKALAMMAALCLLVSSGAWLWSKRKLLLSATVLGLFGLTLAALFLRLAVWHELSAHSSLAFMPLGSDQRGYYQAPALAFVRGLWPGDQGAFYAKPGYTFFVGFCYSLLGPFMLRIKLIQLLLGASVTPLLFVLARRIFDKLTAWIVAFLWVIFPYAIFYEAQILTHALEPLITLAILYGWLKILDDESPWRWLFITGGWLGLAALVRPSFLIAAPLIVLTLLWQRPRQWLNWLQRSTLLAATTLALIAPVTLHNFLYGGSFQLISTEGAVTLYMGNHRDSSGYEWKQGPDAAFAGTLILVSQGKTDYRRATIQDIVNDPNRFVRLLLRKTALLFSNVEMSNNVDFFQDGVALSPTLARLPVRMGTIMTLALTGFLLTWPFLRAPSWGIRILWLFFVANSLLNIAFLVLSRLLAPLYPILLLFAGWALAVLSRQLRQRQWRRLVGTLVIVLGFGLWVNYAIVFADAIMPLPVTQRLPAQTRPLHAALGDSLRLVGYDLPTVAAPGDPIFLNLYWQIDAPLNEDFMGSVQLLNVQGNEKLVQADHRLGEATFPQYKSNQWHPGEIVRDQYLLKLPADLPAPVTLPLLVIAYQFKDGERLGATQIGPLSISFALPPAVPTAAIPVNARIGSATLLAYQAQKNDQRLDLTFYWRATGPLLEDGVIFVHLLDEAKQRIAGDDQRPRNGTYATLGWQPNEGIVDQRQIWLPSDLGDGPLYLALGMYAASTQERLPVWDAQGNELPDRMVLLGPLR